MSQTAEEKAAKAAEKARKSAEKADQEAENEQNKPESDKAAPETQQIKFLRSHPGYAYWPGDTAHLTAEHVTRLVDGGFAELVIEAEPDETAE